MWESMDWIHLAHVRDQWQLVVNAAMNIRISWGGGGDLLTR
jgi:hypothetical protein